MYQIPSRKDSIYKCSEVRWARLTGPSARVLPDLGKTEHLKSHRRTFYFETTSRAVSGVRPTACHGRLRRHCRGIPERCDLLRLQKTQRPTNTLRPFVTSASGCTLLEKAMKPRVRGRRLHLYLAYTAPPPRRPGPDPGPLDLHAPHQTSPPCFLGPIWKLSGEDFAGPMPKGAKPPGKAGAAWPDIRKSGRACPGWSERSTCPPHIAPFNPTQSRARPGTLIQTRRHTPLPPDL